MTKRYVTVVQQAYRHILSDMSVELPEVAAELDRDYMRLSSAIETRGLRFCTIDLVDCGKHFDRCLAQSRLTKFEGPHMRPFKPGSVIPRLFKGLLLRVFDVSGGLHSVPCVQSIRFLRQVYNLAKKVRIECEKERTFDAVRSFYATDARVLLGDLDWESDDLGSCRAFHLDYDDKLRQRTKNHQLSFELGEDGPRLPRATVRAIHFASDVIASTLGLFVPGEWKGRHGPGAVSDRIGRSKYDFPYWPRKLELQFPLADFAYANYALWAEETRSIGSRFREAEAPCKLIAVPKTQKTPRLIASEPTSNQWCQQLIKDFLYTRIPDCWIGNSIHFRDQAFNQQLAKLASISGSHWTIDLSEASDRVSCYVVERFFRRNPSLLDAFHAVRTRFIRNTVDPKQPLLHKLRKFSCMGSALTFPVQSIIFLGVVLGCLLDQRRLPFTIRQIERLSKEVLVFGDDLIVPEDVGHLVLGALRYLGFKVNRNKTFGTGSFRESCGGEYFRGHDVTPVYLLTYPDRRRPESIISFVESRNNFYKGGYFGLANWMKATVESEAKLRLPTLAIDSGAFCWVSFDEVDWSGLRSRFNQFTHQREVLQHIPRGCVRVHPDRTSSRLLQYFTEAPRPGDPWVSGVREVPSSSLARRWVPIRK